MVEKIVIGDHVQGEVVTPKEEEKEEKDAGKDQAKEQ